MKSVSGQVGFYKGTLSVMGPAIVAAYHEALAQHGAAMQAATGNRFIAGGPEGFVPHVTVMDPRELRAAKKATKNAAKAPGAPGAGTPGAGAPEAPQLGYTFSEPVSDLSLLGVGRQCDAPTETTPARECFYIITQSDSIAAWRAARGLAAKDLHITLGTVGGDIHGVPKDVSTLWNPL